MIKFFLSILFLGLMINQNVKAQCPGGQTEVTIDFSSDDYGYEIYWELVPGGNGCGVGTIFAGGNTAVGCGGGSAQQQTPGGYGDNITVSEGPWCLTDNNTYDIIFVDDWGDGGASYEVNIGGFPMYAFGGGSGANTGTVYSFDVVLPFAYDMEGEKIAMNSYVNTGNVDIKGHLYNRSQNTITDLDLNYQIDNGSVVTSSISGLNILPFTDYDFTHPVQWNVSVNGNYTIKAWASNLNGNTDMDMSNDTTQKTVTVGPGIPNLVDNYIGQAVNPTIIAGIAEGVEVPRDLDFHPVLTRKELWVILKSTENVGGKTVKISDAGLVTQTELLQQDGNAWHFMSLPTGIAFSGNENFATSPGVWDANHDGGSPFTGPTLWSSDPAIYAQPSGGNGSHLDMLHESPYSMGIASEEENIFWVNDGDNDCVTYYDFKDDHGPGNSYHGDGIVRRYIGMNLVEDPAYHVPSHLVRDKNSNWLYIADTGNDRIVRLDITSGNQTSTYTPMEGLAEASFYGNYTMEVYVTSGLAEPSGIDIVEDRMIVSDHSNGDIIIYDISGSTGVELGRIQTGTPGIMGVKIGPDGRIWYVNATTNQVVKLEYAPFVGVQEQEENANVLVYPNPATQGTLHVNTNISGNYSGVILDITGKEILNLNLSEMHSTIDISSLATGTYFLKVFDAAHNLKAIKKFVSNR